MVRMPARRRWSRLWNATLLLVVLAVAPAWGGPREQAKRLHDRLVGVPPDAVALDRMAALIASGDALAAAFEAMEHPAFYTTSLKNFATPWTNVERSVFAELNDYTATVIGMVRDGVPFDQVLTADLVYIGAPGTATVPYSQSDNDHYRELERSHANLADPDLLIPVAQSSLPGTQVPASETAGIITTRAAGEAFFSAGTNRRMWRFISINFLCRDLEDMKDNTRPSDRIRQDVSRSPGGDSTIYHNDCSGCHSGMDAISGAFAHFDFDDDLGRVVYTPRQVQAKYLINGETFPYGYVTFDDRWDNFWREGPNAAFGWRGPDSGGYGPKSLGREVAASRAFSECQVRKVFEHVCFRPPGSVADVDEIERVADVFEADQYDLKRVFAEIGIYCMGD